ncbi:hypothetical protein [Natranaerobius thermophilus]|uniref:ECF transporter S component n=1 Tax=Natranaerobius thermophilus (strain ATCC BAA-1301 / DSM 18059 / JW/NM-WN-LF) TaxID=457570 RepID=B2A7A4_NATTJ|nr:hypothetical protein [Natranaerobius thermophilus]ACB84298.1 conserved hypothetical protein [Natranaerobius thermophilus JW/NM-WN-LF]
MKKQLITLITSIVSVIVTYLLNHHLALGPFFANGIVGLSGALLFPKWAGGIYIASFVGMSSTEIIPTLGSAFWAGIIVGLVFANTSPVFDGLGGKGGITAATSVLLYRILLLLIGS